MTGGIFSTSAWYRLSARCRAELLRRLEPSLHEGEQREPSREEHEPPDGLADLTPEPFVDPAEERFEQAGGGAEHHDEEHAEQDPQQIPQRRGPAAGAAWSFAHGRA